MLFCTLALLVLGGCQPGVRQTPEEERTLITVGFSQVGAVPTPSPCARA